MDITVVIPCYNYGTYVGDAINSVLGQTHPVREIIVVDDGSTDNTTSQVAHFGKSVQHLYQAHRGLSSARNAGIQAAKYPWIAFLDADDWWLPRKLERQVEALRAWPAAVLSYTSLYVVNGAEVELIVPTPSSDSLFPTLRYRNCMIGGASSALVRRDILVQQQGFNESLTASEDWDLWFRIASSYPLIHVPEPLIVRRVHPSNHSRDTDRWIINVEKMTQSTLLAGLHGWRRYCWARRIRSAVYYRAAIQLPKCWQKKQLLLRSVMHWPIPDVMPERWIALARILIGGHL